MDIAKIRRIPRKHRRTIHLTVRVSPEIKAWLRENEYSATKIFNESIKELGYKEDCIEEEPGEYSRKRRYGR